MSTFSSRLKKAMSIRKVTTQKLSELSGVSPSSITDYRKGRSIPREQRLLSLANVLQVNPDWLLGTSNETEFKLVEFDQFKHKTERVVKDSIQADGKTVNIISFQDGSGDFISLTDIARYRSPESPADLIKNWLRSRSTLEFIGLWEIMNNPEFKQEIFNEYLNQSGANSFLMSPKKWTEETNATFIVSKGGTFAHAFKIELRKRQV